jgi:hypothetical protein
MLPGDFTVSEGHGHPLVNNKYQDLMTNKIAHNHLKGVHES